MKQKAIRIYTPQNSIIELQHGEKERHQLFSVFEFANYIQSEQPVKGYYTLQSTAFKQLKKDFFSTYKIVEAAGGIVFNEQDEILLIHRRGYWDLPKGKLEKDETKKECAIREVEEETGLQGLQLIGPLRLFYNEKKTTYHTYKMRGRFVLKPSYWYLMSAPKQELTPQTEEDIEQAIWVPRVQLKNYIPQAYPTIQDILHSI